MDHRLQPIAIVKAVRPMVVGFVWYVTVLAILSVPVRGEQQDGCDEKVSAQIRVDTGSPWRPSFGLDRVGAPPVVHVELRTEQAPRREYFLVAYRGGRETERKSVTLERNPTGGVWGRLPDAPSPFYGLVPLSELPEEVALIARCASDGRIDEVKRQTVEWPQIEADATARPDRLVNPVDLGAILIPKDRLLLAGGQAARVKFAAISRTHNFPNARLKVWFESDKPVEMDLPLSRDQRLVKNLELPPSSAADSDVLHLTLTEDGRELWRKDIPSMIVANPPRNPEFGAVEMKLRYDAPIAVGDKVVDYNTAWDSKLNDVVVFLPNGSRFVFWRWWHYAPFWAGPYNTGFNYEWAENLTHPFKVPDGSVLFPEPSFDSELRYGRARIMESTSSRVHVRWTYQGTDTQYRIWGEHVTEDYYFYPDGFGTRVMTLSSAPDADYEVSEFIILTPRGVYPFEVLPEKMIEMLYVDGKRRDINFPNLDKNFKPYGNTHFVLPDVRKLPAIYRIFLEKDDPAPAIFFNPRHVPQTLYVYRHRYDEAEVITPALGSLGVNSPGVNCFLTAIKDVPRPFSISTYPMLDTLGQSREMMIRRWAWLIAKTNAPDEELLEWAQSYSAPPSLEVTGAHIDFPSYIPERRAMRLVADAPSIEIKVKPATHCVNPVFELAGAPKELAGVTLDGVQLAADAFAWDGSTLWVKARIDSRGATISLQFRRRTATITPQ